MHPAPPGNAPASVGDTPQLVVSTTTAPVPKLLKSTQTAQTAPTAQAPAQVQQLQLPQLPPAQIQETKTDEGENRSEATQSNQLPQPAPQAVLTPKVVPQKINDDI